MTVPIPVDNAADAAGLTLPTAAPAPSPARRWRTLVPAMLSGLAVLAQICYPLVHGHLRTQLTVATVLIFFAAAVAAAWQSCGAGWTSRVVALTLAVSLLVEAIGTATGLPFGSYRYTSTLGVQVLSVPLLVPFAWVMMTIPALAVARHSTRHRGARIAVATLALASWDVFLDPQLVSAGYWRWGHPQPGIGGVPLTNFAGWLLAAALLMLLLDRLAGLDPPQRPAAVPLSGDALLIGLYLWTYASSLLANLAFFHRPPVALAGALVMGLPAVLAARGLRPATGRAAR